MTKKPLQLPDSFVALLAAADTKHKFPPGTLYSVLQQEVGGNVSKYLNDPAMYHYPANAEGKRIAGHTGKVSTAFGPFGILESTAAQPGYGVAPLKNKSLEEQVRFAGEYLAARTKQAGSLEAGLAGYGEGAKYGQQVAKRIPQLASNTVVPTFIAPVATNVEDPPAVFNTNPTIVPYNPLEQISAVVPAQNQVIQEQAPVITPQNLQYTQPDYVAATKLQVPDFMAALGAMQTPQTNIAPFNFKKVKSNV